MTKSISLKLRRSRALKLSFIVCYPRACSKLLPVTCYTASGCPSPNCFHLFSITGLKKCFITTDAKRQTTSKYFSETSLTAGESCKRRNFAKLDASLFRFYKTFSLRRTSRQLPLLVGGNTRYFVTQKECVFPSEKNEFRNRYN